MRENQPITPDVVLLLQGCTSRCGRTGSTGASWGARWRLQPSTLQLNQTY